MRRKHGALSGALPLLLLAACGSDEPTRRPTPAFSITAPDRSLSDPARIQIDRIEATSEGFIAIYRIEDGEEDALLGAAAFAAGTSSISVELDEEVPENGTLLARLHRDDGQLGVFENEDDPARDAPILLDGEEISVRFEVVREVQIDDLAASDPILVELALLSVDRVDLQGSGFIRVSQAVQGESTLPSLGARLLEAGRHLDVGVAMARDLVDGEQIVVTLHEDSDGDGALSWDGSPQSADPPLRDPQDAVIERLLTVSSTISPEESVLALDQVATSSVVDIALTSVVASEAGFVAAYALDESDAIVLPALGHLAVPQGLSVMPSIPGVQVGSSTVAERLRLQLHRDSDADGVFEYDGGDLDPPALDAEDQPIRAELTLGRAVP